MKKLFIFVFVLFVSITVANAESTLEPCKTDNNKFGEVVEYIEFLKKNPS